MAPSTVASSATLDLFCQDEEVISTLEKKLSGCPLPQNVSEDIDPYRIKPSNLPGDIWCYVKCNGSTGSSLGHWKQKGEHLKVCSNSSSTGWVTTYEFYEDQAAHEHKMVWVMKKYWMSGADENSKQKETSSLCKVFLEYKRFQNHEKIQKSDSSTVSKSEAINPNHQLVVPDASKNMKNNGSTSKSEISGDDKMVELPVAGKPLDNHSEDGPSEMDDIAKGYFLELNDIGDPVSPSSSSDSSSCLTMSSDERFDVMALLQDLERDINRETTQRDAACVRPTLPSKLNKKAVNRGPSESLVSVKKSSNSPTEANSTVPKPSPPIEGLKKPEVKQPPSQSKKAGHGASSSTSHSKSVPNGQETATGGKKKKSSKFPYCFG